MNLQKGRDMTQPLGRKFYKYDNAKKNFMASSMYHHMKNKNATTMAGLFKMCNIFVICTFYHFRHAQFYQHEEYK